MNETLLQIAAAQQLTAWAVAFTAILTLIGVIVGAVVLWLTRDIWHDQQRVADALRQTNFYLFKKLGPADTD